MLSGVVLLVIGSILASQFYDLPLISYVGVLIPITILTVIGYRAVSTSQSGEALGDERTAKLFRRVGLNSFWILMTLIAIDGLVEIIPRENISTAYLLLGTAVYVLYFAYYRYVE